jgi:hypothetical protein
MFVNQPHRLHQVMYDRWRRTAPPVIESIAYREEVGRGNVCIRKGPSAVASFMLPSLIVRRASRPAIFSTHARKGIADLDGAEDAATPPPRAAPVRAMPCPSRSWAIPAIRRCRPSARTKSGRSVVSEGRGVAHLARAFRDEAGVGVLDSNKLHIRHGGEPAKVGGIVETHASGSPRWRRCEWSWAPPSDLLRK